MSDQLPDGRYRFEAQNAYRLLTDLDGMLVATRVGTGASNDQTWELTNDEDGTTTLRCVGSTRCLALSTRSGLYYKLGLDPEPWRLGKLGDAYELIRATTNRRLWLSDLYLLDAIPICQQGEDQDVVPTRWLITPV